MNQQDELTTAEHLADACARQQSRGRHGIAEFPTDDRYRQLRTEMAERALDDLKQRGFTLSRPQVVETIDQLASLPDEAWIRDRAGDFGIKRDWALDLAVYYPILGHWKTNATIPVPATVLHLPEETP